MYVNSTAGPHWRAGANATGGDVDVGWPPSACSTRELESVYGKLVYIYAAPPIVLAGVVGNALSAGIYAHRFLRGSATVRLLTCKAAAALLYLLSVAHMSAYHATYAYETSNAFSSGGDPLAAFYWKHLAWTLFISNTLSTVTVWLSVCVTGEHFALVTMPVRCRDVLTMRRANALCALTVAAAGALHSYNVLCAHVSAVPCDHGRVKYLYTATDTCAPGVHIVYYFVNMGASVIIPLCLMILFAGGLYFKLVMRGRFKQTLNEQKRCILSLAVATAGCHLALETPHALVLLVAAAGGNERRSWAGRAHSIMLASATTLSLAHAALPFFIYLLLSKRFRSIFCSMCAPCCCIGGIGGGNDDYELHTTDGRRARNGDAPAAQCDDDEAGAAQQGAHRHRAQSEPAANVHTVRKAHDKGAPRFGTRRKQTDDVGVSLIDNEHAHDNEQHIVHI